MTGKRKLGVPNLDPSKVPRLNRFSRRCYFTPSKYDPKKQAKPRLSRSIAVRLVVEHRDYHPSAKAATTTVSKRLWDERRDAVVLESHRPSDRSSPMLHLAAVVTVVAREAPDTGAG